MTEQLQKLLLPPLCLIVGLLLTLRKRHLGVRNRDSPVYSQADLKSAGTLFFSLDFCVMSQIELFPVSFVSSKSLVSVLS